MIGSLATLLALCITPVPADRPLAVAAEWHVSASPVLSIGVAAGRPEYELHLAYGVTRLSDGRIVIANGGTNELRFFAADGRFLKAVGREGEGPGEFRRLGRIWKHRGDSIIAFDNRTHRLSVFSPAGEFVRAGSIAGAVAGRHLSPIGLFPDGTLLAETVVLPPQGVYDRAVRDSVTYVRARLSGELVATLGSFPGTDHFIRAEGVGRTVMPRIFGRQTHAVVAADRVFVGTQDRYEIHAVEPGGTVTPVVRQPDAPRRVTRDDVTRMKRDWVAQASSAGGRAFREGLVDDMPMPSSMPAHGRMHGDSEGLIWVEEYRLPSETPARWTVFDARGRLVARVVLPHDLEVREIGRDYLLGTAVDASGVESVRLHSLRRG